MLKMRHSMLVGLGFVLLTCAAAIAQSKVEQPAPLSGAAWSGSLYQTSPFQALHAESTQLAQQLVKSTKAEEKQELRKKLNDLLTKQFDANVQHQQKELDEVEKQINELRALLKKRQDAKATIVERRIEQLIQEAEGLGWTAPGTSLPRNSYVAPSHRTRIP